MPYETKAEATAQALLDRHPMQRLPSPSRGTSAVLHAFGLASFAYSFQFLVDNPNPINQAHGWHFQYLTILGLSAATVTFAIALLADLTLSSRIFFVKNVALVVSAPIEVLISILYWGISSVDPKLVVPEHLPRPPLSADLSFHAIPAIVLTLDLLFFSPPWTISAGPMMGVSGIIATAYWFWVERNFALNGFYPYPIFEVHPTHRIGIFIGASFVSTGSALTLKWLYSVVNGSMHTKSRAYSGKVNKQ